MTSLEVIENQDESSSEYHTPPTGEIAKVLKRSPEEPVDGENKPKKKKKVNQIIKNFAHHVCSPISNEKRRKAVASILGPTHNFNAQELDELWKGMFFVVWYTEVTKCEEILYDIAYGCKYSNEKEYLLAGFKLLAKEWMGIDFYRVDKYALLVRHMTNRCFRIAILETEPRDFEFLNDIFVISVESVELFNHIVEIYLEELQNVTMRQVIWKPNDKCDVYVAAIRPIIKAIPRNTDSRALITINESIFQESRNMLESECEAEWRDRFFQEIFKELINTGKEENVSAKNRKFLFRVAGEFKEIS